MGGLRPRWGPRSTSLPRSTAMSEADRKPAVQPQDRRLGRLRLLLRGGVSWAALTRREGQAPAATVEARAGAVTVYRRHNKPALAPPATASTILRHRSVGAPHDCR